MYRSEYEAKLTDSRNAVASVCSGSVIAVSQAISQPAALMYA